jgi:hypothetical protein
MIASMSHNAQKHALDVLVIDEIQHLADSRVVTNEVLNFLVTLENEIRLPIFFIETYKAVKNDLIYKNKLDKLIFSLKNKRTPVAYEKTLGFLNSLC